jgi:hypothetical protein
LYFPRAHTEEGTDLEIVLIVATAKSSQFLERRERDQETTGLRNSTKEGSKPNKKITASS